MPPLPRIQPIVPQPREQHGLPTVFTGPTPQAATWRLVKRIQLGAAVTDTSFFGDLPLPPQGIHAKVIISDAIDTSANTSASFGSLQIAINGALITTGNYHWVDWAAFNNAGALSSGVTGSGANDTRWGAFVTTGGGTGAVWPSSAEITFPQYANPNMNAVAFWDIQQINSGTIVRRMGSGYCDVGAGAVTSAHFACGSGNLAFGTTFDLLVLLAT